MWMADEQRRGQASGGGGRGRRRSHREAPYSLLSAPVHLPVAGWVRVAARAIGGCNRQLASFLFPTNQSQISSPGNSSHANPHKPDEEITCWIEPACLMPPLMPPPGPHRMRRTSEDVAACCCC